MTKPQFEPTFSFGTLAVIIGGLFVAASIWVALSVGLARSEAKAEALDRQTQEAVEAIEKRVSRVEDRLEDRLTRMEGKIDRILAAQR